MEAMVSGKVNLGLNTSSQDGQIHQLGKIDTIKLIAKNNNFETLATYLRQLCGPQGHVQIIERNNHLEIHLFFDSQTQRNSFKRALENDFENRCDHTLTFKNDQTQADPQHNSLYPLKLNEYQSISVLYDDVYRVYDLSDAQGTLRKIQEYLPKQSPLIPNGTNHAALSTVCSLVPIQSVLNFATTCKSANRFVNHNENFWTSRLESATHSDLPLVALEQAKFFEAKYNGMFPLRTRHDNQVVSDYFSKAVEYYIATARSDVPEAIRWLETELASSALASRDEDAIYEFMIQGKQTLTSAEQGEAHLTLGDFYAKIENPDQKLVSEHYASAWDLLKENAESGDYCFKAILALYNRNISDKPASEVNEFLESLLPQKIEAVSNKDTEQKAISWILNVFSPNAKLPLFFQNNSEQALLAALNGLGFDHRASYSYWGLFRYERHDFDRLRSVVETRLNHVLGTLAYPIKFRFILSTLNLDKVLILPEDKNDTTKFVKAVQQSDLAPFFAALTELVPGDKHFTHKNAIALTKESWDQFKAVISK